MSEESVDTITVEDTSHNALDDINRAGDQIRTIFENFIDSFKDTSEQFRECAKQIRTLLESARSSSNSQQSVASNVKGDTDDYSKEISTDGIVKTKEAFDKLSSSSASIGNALSNLTSAFSGLTQSGGGLGSVLSSLGGVLAALFDPAVAIAAAAAAVVFQMKLFSDFSAKTVSGAKDFGQALGLSATKASTVQFALNGMGTSSDMYAKAVQNVDKILHENEELLQKIGVKTRDSSGELRDAKEVVVEAARAFEQYKDGLERGALSQRIMGVAVKDAENISNLNNETLKEARDRQESLGLVVGKRNVEAQEKYEKAMTNSQAVLRGLVNAVGEVFMPILTEMAEWFNSAGPAAIKVTRGAVALLTQNFWEQKRAISSLWELCKWFVKGVGEDFRGLAEVLNKVFHLDFSGADKAWDERCKRVLKMNSELSEKLSSINKKTVEEQKNALSSQTEDAIEPKRSGKNREDQVSPIGSYLDIYKQIHDATPIGTFVESRATTTSKTVDKQQRRNASNKEAVVGEQIGLDEEIVGKRYEAGLISEQQLFEKQEEFANRRYDLELKALMKEMTLTQSRPEKHKEVLARIVALETKHKKDLEAIQSQKKGEKKDDPEADALREVEIDEQIAQIQLNNKIIDQKKMLELEEQFENRRYEIKLKGMKERMALASKEGNGDEQKKLAKDEEALEKAHQAKLKDIKKRGAQEDKSVMFTAMKELGSKLGDVWESHIEKLIKGGFKWRNVYKDSVSAVRTWFLSNIKKMATQWISSEESKTGATLAGIATRNAAEVAAAAKSMAIWAASAIKNILNLAWEAMAATYTAFASMGPWGAALGVAAAAGAFALVSGMAGNVASASGGYDIPAGVNPMTQLHEQEMVLPAHIANPLRSMIASGSESGGGGGDTHVHISAVDAKSVKRLLRDNGRAITDAVKGAVKDGYRA